MSTNLYWLPVSNIQGNSLDESGPELKKILRSKGQNTFSNDDFDWLSGLEAAGVPGASGLIRAILDHDSVNVWEE